MLKKKNKYEQSASWTTTESKSGPMLRLTSLRLLPMFLCTVAFCLFLATACDGKGGNKVALPNDVGGASHSFRAKTVFTDTFDRLSGWMYSPDSPSEAVFHVSHSLLTVGSYGSGALPSGPRIVHTIPQLLSTDTDNFVLEVVMFTSEGGRYGRVSVSMLDQDQVPVVEMTWEPGRYVHLIACGLKKNAYSDELAHPFSGKLSIRHIGAKYSLHLNDGPELTSIPVTQKKKLRYIKIEVVRTDSTYMPPDIKIDLIRLLRIVGSD